MLERPTIAVVQICGFKLPKGSTNAFDNLYPMVPSVDTEWEELTDEISYESWEKLEGQPHFHSDHNCTMNQDVIALQFNSVGDWPDGYSSWFDYEIEMVGIDDVIKERREELFQAIDEEFKVLERCVFKGSEATACSILTLWEGRSWQDWEGEYEFDYDYLGVLKDLKKAL